jgi:mRNA interferase RelE/StbE
MYILVFSDEFKRQLAKITKKDKILKERIIKKVLEIKENPESYKPLKYGLKGKRRTHIGSFVLFFEIKGNVINILTIVHHDKAY